MRHRTRSRSSGCSIPFVLAAFGVFVGIVGVLCLTVALSLLGAVETAGAEGNTEEFLPLVFEPLAFLYQGGLLTVAGGCVLTLVGGTLVVRS